MISGHANNMSDRKSQLEAHVLVLPWLMLVASAVIYTHVLGARIRFQHEPSEVWESVIKYSASWIAVFALTWYLIMLPAVFASNRLCRTCHYEIESYDINGDRMLQSRCPECGSDMLAHGATAYRRPLGPRVRAIIWVSLAAAWLLTSIIWIMKWVI